MKKQNKGQIAVSRFWITECDLKTACQEGALHGMAATGFLFPQIARGGNWPQRKDPAGVCGQADGINCSVHPMETPQLLDVLLMLRQIDLLLHQAFYAFQAAVHVPSDHGIPEQIVCLHSRHRIMAQPGCQLADLYRLLPIAFELGLVRELYFFGGLFPPEVRDRAADLPLSDGIQLLRLRRTLPRDRGRLSLLRVRQESTRSNKISYITGLPQYSMRCNNRWPLPSRIPPRTHSLARDEEMETTGTEYRLVAIGCVCCLFGLRRGRAAPLSLRALLVPICEDVELCLHNSLLKLLFLEPLIQVGNAELLLLDLVHELLLFQPGQLQLAAERFVDDVPVLHDFFQLGLQLHWLRRTSLLLLQPGELGDISLGVNLRASACGIDLNMGRGLIRPHLLFGLN